MSVPDRIWASAGSYPQFDEEDWENASASAFTEFGTEYLRATPAREHAEELAEALRRIVMEADLENADLGIGDCVEGRSGLDCWISSARAALAKLEKEEGK